VPPTASFKAQEIRSGTLSCRKCKAQFPILAGVALLVPDVHGYLNAHIKGISKVVPDSEIPDEWLETFLEAKMELQNSATEHIEEDLEAERVNALYVMNHYLQAHPLPADPWWRPTDGMGSPLMDTLIQEHWDHGPFRQIASWVRDLPGRKSARLAVELGCGVGGLYSHLRKHLHFYLGVDSSFASIALARHLQLGVPYDARMGIPADLLSGPTSRPVQIKPRHFQDGSCDWVVADVENPPLRAGQWDLSLSLNMIDMLEDPATLPRLQHKLIKAGGLAIQSCPYIWHEAAAKKLRARLPKTVRDSASAIEYLYKKTGLSVQKKVAHVPWLFFKHLRQLELYSVHMFLAKKELSTKNR